MIGLKPNNSDSFSYFVEENGSIISDSVYIANEFNE